MELTQTNLEAEMTRITKEEGKIPSVLWVEMALRNIAGVLTSCVANADGDGRVEHISQYYPDLVVRVWSKPGWKLE